ncbi:MAG: hypothetical protein ACFNYB_03720 [Campylobacter sp.]
MVLKRLLFIYGALWAALTLAGAFAGVKFIASSQTAFFAALLIAAATFFSYKRRAELRLLNDRDEILALEAEKDEAEAEIWGDENLDAQNLANEKMPSARGENLGGENSARENLKDEKARLKRQKTSLKDMNLTAAFTPYRLLAYAALALGFLALKRKEMLDIAGFLIGLAGMPLGAMIFGVLGAKARDGE